LPASGQKQQGRLSSLPLHGRRAPAQAGFTEARLIQALGQCAARRALQIQMLRSASFSQFRWATSSHSKLLQRALFACA
jgi:hypothetical protein